MLLFRTRNYVANAPNGGTYFITDEGLLGFTASIVYGEPGDLTVERIGTWWPSLGAATEACNAHARRLSHAA